MSISPTIPGIERLTLTVNQEIQVNASLEATFEALLEQIGPENETPQQQDADEARGLARRPVVSRSRRRQRPLLGTRAGDQAADRLLEITGPLVHVGRCDLQRAIPTDGIEGRHVDQVSSQSIWRDPGTKSPRRGRGLGQHPRQDQGSSRAKFEVRK